MAVASNSPGFIFSNDVRTGASTPEELKRRRAIAEALWARNSGQMPKDATEGLFAMGQALIHRVGMNNLAKEEAAGRAQTAAAGADLARGMGGFGADPTASPGAGFGGATGAIGDASDARFTMGNAGREIASNPSDAGIYDSFIGTVKDSGLSNPYGLAAVAATGQAESGYSAKNAFGEWSDPSESGGAGQAGGVMSWRAERLANMRRFAEQAGDNPSRPSPATQAKFFMNEDPSLIAKLQSAQSVEEAQQHMNNAWRFAGYDRPGGEAARRMKAAAGFLPRFADAGGAGSAAPVQVASADAADAMAYAAPQQPSQRPANASMAIMAALNPSQASGISAPVRDGIAANVAAGTLRGETLGAGGSTMDPRDIAARQAAQDAERASNPNIRPYSGPAEIDGREVGSPEARIAAALGIQPEAPRGMSPIAAALNQPASAAPPSPTQPQAQRLMAALNGQPAPPMPPAQNVGANPVPPGAGLDLRTSPAMRQEMLSGNFDGMGFQNAAGSAPAAPTGLGLPAIPAAPGAAPAAGMAPMQQGGDAPASPASGIDERVLMSVLQNPWATDEQKQIAIGAIQEQRQARLLAQKQSYDRRMQLDERAYERMTEQEKREYEAGVRREGYGREDQRFGVTDARDDARLDLERQRFDRDGRKRDIITIFDEATGRDRKGYLDENSRFVPVGGVEAPKDANGITIGPDGTVQIGGPSKPLTEGQSKDTVFSTRAAGALPILDKYAPALTSRTDRALGAAPYDLGRGFQDTDFQLAQQAGDEFLQAILRKDTGAAITADEQALYGTTYLPRPGDAPELQEQKRASRTRALEAIKAGMPPAAIVAQELALRRSGGGAPPTSNPYRDKYGLE